jgi:hypothetical protein
MLPDTITNLIGGLRSFRLHNWRYACLNNNGHISVREQNSHWAGDPTSLWKMVFWFWNMGHHFQLIREAAQTPYNQ